MYNKPYGYVTSDGYMGYISDENSINCLTLNKNILNI